MYLFFSHHLNHHYQKFLLPLYGLEIHSSTMAYDPRKLIPIAKLIDKINIIVKINFLYNNISINNNYFKNQTFWCFKAALKHFVHIIRSFFFSVFTP